MEIEKNFAVLNQVWPQQPTWLMKERQKYGAQFRDRGWPRTSWEAYKYTSFREVEKLAPLLHVGEFDRKSAKSALQPYLQSATSYQVVFVDGRFVEEWSNYPSPMVQILSAQGAVAEEWLRPLYALDKAWQDDPFQQLRSAYFTGGFAVRIRADAILDKPLQVISYLSDSLSSSGADGLPAFYLQNWIEVGARSRLAVVETTISASASRYFLNSSTRLICSKSTSVDYARVSQHSAGGFAVQGLYAECGENARVNLTEATLASGLVRNDMLCALKEPGAHLTSNGMYFVSEAGHVDNHTRVEHRVPNCQSSQLYKGIVADSARAVFDGSVLIAKGADQTNASQLNKNLLLSEKAEVDTKPNLEIYADDVKATHGASIGRLNEDEIFYLQSRAIGREQAMAMLCQGFLEDVVYRIEDHRLLAMVDQIVRPALLSLEGVQYG